MHHPRPRSLPLLAGVALALSAATAPVLAGYTTQQSASGAQMVGSLLAPSSGITVDGGSIVTLGAPRQNGSLLTFNVPQRAMPGGIGLSTGHIAAPNEPNYGGGNIITASGAHDGISAARGLPTYDQSVLGFSFRVEHGIHFVSGLMVFGSEEYPIWLDSVAYGDGVLIRVDGVAVSSIDGQAFSLTTAHQRFGVEPDPSGAGATGWNGLTPLLRFTGALDAQRSVHTIEFAIADTGDAQLDSALFLSSLRGLEAGQGAPGLALAVPEPATWALWLVGLAATLRARPLASTLAGLAAA